MFLEGVFIVSFRKIVIDFSTSQMRQTFMQVVGLSEKSRSTVAQVNDINLSVFLFLLFISQGEIEKCSFTQGYRNRYIVIDRPTGSGKFCEINKGPSTAWCSRMAGKQLLFDQRLFSKHVKSYFIMSTIDKIIPVYIALLLHVFSCNDSTNVILN